MGFNSSPGAVQGLQCAPSAFLQTLAVLQDEHDAEAKHGLSPSSSAAGLGMSNVVMFHLVMPQKAPAAGEESGTETMAKNSAFRGRWCFCTAEGKGCIPWLWDNPQPFHGAGECSASIWRTSWRIRTLLAQLCSEPKCQKSLCTLESDLLPLRSQKTRALCISLLPLPRCFKALYKAAERAFNSPSPGNVWPALLTH